MKRYIYIYLFLIAFCSSVGNKMYSQSSNCGTATSIPLTGTSICVNGTTVGALLDTITYGSCNTSPNHTVWYTYVTTGSTNTFAVTPGTFTNPEIVLFLGCPGVGGILQYCNAGLGSAVLNGNFSFSVGQQVYIGIASNQGSEGTFQLCINSTIPPAIGGQFCTTALPICVPSFNLASMSAYGSSGQKPSCFGNPVQQDVWVSFTVVQSGVLAWTASHVAGTEYDWCLWDITAGCPGTEVCCNYNYSNHTALSFGMQNSAGNQTCGPGNTGNAAAEFSPTVGVVAGNTYAIQVSNYDDNSTGFSIAFPNSTCIITPNAAFTVTPTSFVCGTSLTAVITNTSLGGPQVWDYGDGTATYTGTTPPNHTYNTPGTYAITETMSGICPTAATQFVQLYGALSATSAMTQATCSACNGIASIASVTGGDGTYNYAWAPSGGNAPQATGLCPGNYTCTVSNPTCGSSVTETVAVTAGGLITGVDTTVTSSTCGKSNGVAAVTAVTGTPGPYTYSWSTTATGATLTNVAAGTYTVSVSSGAGCHFTQTAIIGNITGPSASIPSFTNGNCNVGSSGTATVAPTGGTGAYTFNWAPAGGTGLTAINLAPATYTCTVSDANGCTATSAVIITNPPAITATNSQTNVSCNGGADGTATVNPGGGTPAYTYSWGPVGGTAATATGLSSGVSICTITDSKGCAFTSQVTLTQPAVIAIPVTPVSATCGNSNGSATIAATGGTGAYTYTWSPSVSTGATASGLFSGTYFYTVTDAKGCEKSSSVAISNSGGPVATLPVSTNVSCNGGANGTASTTVSGGLPNYLYSWSPTGGTSAAAAGLPAGIYTVHVSDANGCLTTATATITEPAILGATIAPPTNVNCNGNANGSATAIATGGTGTYTYAWTPTGGTGATASNLDAGTYSCSIKDANGCQTVVNTAITQPMAPLSLTAAGVNTACNLQPSGEIVCIPAGGTSPYGYSWNTGCTNISCNNVAIGNYTVTVTDLNHCTTTATAVVGQPSAIALTPSSSKAHCNKPDGSASVTVNGGTGPTYTYSWNPAIPGSNTATYNNILPGTYTVYVTDANACKDSLNIVVIDTAGVLANIPKSTPPVCFGGANGTASAVASGGAPTYTYSWLPAPGAGQGTANVTGLSAGIYSCVIVDNNKCADTASVTISQPGQLVVTPMSSTIICYGKCTPLTATASGGNGGPFTFTWLDGTTPVTPPVCPTTNTTYNVIASDTAHCLSVTGTVTINVNPKLSLLATPGDSSICPGGSIALNASASGGNGLPYTYIWSPGASLSDSTVSNPVSTPTKTTTYTVIVKDNCGTPADTAYVKIKPYPVPIPVLTAGDSIGCAPVCINFSGSSTPGCVNANWNFGDGSPLVTGCGNQTHCYKKSGSFTVSLDMTDLNGCPSNLTKVNYITAYPLPKAAFTANPKSASILSPTIAFTDQSTNAAAWTWNFGVIPVDSSNLQNPSYTYADTGCYNVMLQIADSIGCTDSTSSKVCIYSAFTFYAPNTFTPNGDNINEIWKPQGLGISPNNYSLIIFDRWGNLIFETSVWDTGWDGRANLGNNPAQQDVYTWKVSLYDINGNKHSYIGLITLIR